MWKLLKELLTYNNDNVVGIDIGTSSIKIAEITFSENGPLLRRINNMDLPRDIIENGYINDVAQLTETLRQAIAMSAITAKQAVIAVGGQAIFVREVVLPVMNTEELREALRWDMDKYIPYQPESYFFDFAKIGSEKNEMEQRILLAAAPHDIVNAIVAAVKAVGLKPIAVDIEPLAIYRTLEEAENSLIIDIGELETQVTVFQKGTLAVTRAIAMGGNKFTQVTMNVLELDFNEAENLKQRQKSLLSHPDLSAEPSEIDRQLRLVADDLAREVRRTVEYYQIQNRESTIDKIVVTGGGAKLDNLAEHLSIRLGSSVVRHTPPLMINIAGAIDNYYFRENFPQMAVAIGLALRGTKYDANQPASTV